MPRIRKTDSISLHHGSKPGTGAVSLLIGTRKGAFILAGDKARRIGYLDQVMILF